MKESPSFSEGMGYQYPYILKIFKLMMLFLFLVLLPVQATGGVQNLQQNPKVSGKVVDKSGEPLIGVTVKVKGTANGTITDVNGGFSIDASQGMTLVFTYLGYKPVNKVIEKTDAVLDIAMEEAYNEMEEVVVVGYGVQKKLSLTGSVANIKSKDIMTTKSPSLAVALAGKVPGLQIKQQSGMPGEFNTSINIRGFGNPLYVIDGVVRDGDREFQLLNPEDIESISVLKDASAAIYGINSSNGVIIVKTKGGSEGPMRIVYNGLVGFSKPTARTKTFDVRQFAEISNEGEIYAGRAPIYSTREAFEAAASKPYTDWYSEVFKKSALQHQHNLSISGGSEKIQTFINLGYMTDNGLLKSGDLGYHKYSLRSNIKAQVTNNFTASLNLSGWTDKRYQPGTLDNAYFFLAKSVYNIVPWEPVYANNNPAYYNNPAPLSQNPVAASYSDTFGYRNWKNRNFQSTIDLTYSVPFVKGLQLKLVGAYDMRVSSDKRVQKSVDLYNYSSENGEYMRTSIEQPFIMEGDHDFTRLDGQAQVLYNNKIGDHNFGGTFVFEMKEENTKYLEGRRVYDFFSGEDIGQAPSDGQSTNGWSTKQRFMSYIGKANYDFKSRYLIEFAFRYDGSYRYNPDKRWGFFPVVSGGWRASEESFIKNNFPFISNLKLRGSYGKTGYDAGDPFQYMPGFIKYGGYVMGNNVFTDGYTTTPLMNDKLTWFTSRTMDIGLDLSINDGLFSFEIDVYRRNRSGLLKTRSQSVPNTFGADLPEENLNKDRTDGIEFLIGHRNKIGDFDYNVTANMNFARTKTIFDERADFRSSWDEYRNGWEGRWQDIGWGYNIVGRYQNYEQIRNGIITSTDRGNSYMLPGDYIYEDLNGDGIIDGKDAKPIYWMGGPKLHYGMTIQVGWKGFDLNVLLQGSALNSVRYHEVMGSVLAFNGNSPSFYYDRWHQADPYDPNSVWIPGEWPATRTTDYDAGAMRYENSKNRVNASYLRLKNLEIGYTLPGKVLKPLGVQNMRVFVNGYNLFMICNKYLKNFDPEVSEGGEGYGFTYPLSVSYNFGVNITF